MARSAAWLLAIATSAAPVAAQSPVVGIDTIAAVDATVDEAGNTTTGIIFDAVASVRLGRGVEAIVRPIAQRFANGEWNRQIWVAALRYERPGDVGVRVDAGLIPSPVGTANLMLRPHLNPTIALPSALFAALPAQEQGARRTTLLGAVYGYGASATVSGAHWDARVGVVDTSPARTRRVFASPGQNPPRFPTVVFGGGVTPVVGVRVGASVTSTGWQKAGETPPVTTDRGLIILAIESEVSFRHTRLVGEWVRDSFETASGREVANGWWVQGQQTLSPRWFTAARVERITAPQIISPGPTIDLRLMSVEETLGFRLTPELTFRLGHRARRPFAATGYDHQLLMSAVWWKRW